MTCEHGLIVIASLVAWGCGCSERTVAEVASSSVAVRWLDDEHLRITLDTRGVPDDFETPIVKEAKWGHVAISYETR